MDSGKTMPMLAVANIQVVHAAELAVPQCQPAEELAISQLRRTQRREPAFLTCMASSSLSCVLLRA